jgi:hypothetical protein
MIPRQWQVATPIVMGLTSEQVARALVVALRTAETHVTDILQRLSDEQNLVSPTRVNVATWVARRVAALFTLGMSGEEVAGAPHVVPLTSDQNASAVRTAVIAWLEGQRVSNRHQT